MRVVLDPESQVTTPQSLGGGSTNPTYLRADHSKNVSDITHRMLVLPPARAGVGIQPALHCGSLGLGEGGEQHDVVVF